MRIVLLILLVLFFSSCTAIIALADSASNSLNLSLPNASQNFQADKFRAGELDCSNAIGSATNWEFGVTGIIQGADNNKQTGDIGVYSRITIPLGARARSRIDCNRLYDKMT